MRVIREGSLLKLSSRALGVSPSPTLSIDAKVKQMKADGMDIVGFGAGEPDFDTPEVIKAAAITALRQGFTKYTPAGGIPELKQAICAKAKSDTGLEYSPAEAVVNCGAKHSLYNIFQVLCEPGDEIIIFAPYWVSYPEMVKLAGGVPIFVETTAADGFKPDIELVRAAITPRTRGLIVNSPSNPTGAVLDRADLAAIAEVALENDLYIISDEIYDKLIYDKVFVSIATLSQDVKARTIVVNGASKTFSMTGWRIGWTLGDRAVISAIADLQSHSTSNPTSIAQKAVLAALTDPAVDMEVVKMVAEFSRRRDILVEKLRGIPGITCGLPDGAFYVFPDVSALYGRSFEGKALTGSDSLTDALLTGAGVAVVPGSGFGADAHVRMAFATSLEAITSGVERFAAFVSRLD